MKTSNQHFSFSITVLALLLYFTQIISSVVFPSTKLFHKVPSSTFMNHFTNNKGNFPLFELFMGALSCWNCFNVDAALLSAIIILDA